MCKRFFLLFFLMFPAYGAPGSAITYAPGGGRFGDKLIHYCHAKWLSYTYNLPLLYRPFQYSEQLMLHECDVPFIDTQTFKNTVTVTRNLKNMCFDNPDTLFVVSYFPEAVDEICTYDYPYFAVDWEDLGFKALLRQCIVPRYKVADIVTLPKDAVSVAVHVRRGGGFDPQCDIDGAVLKFPPDSFYVEQITYLAQLFRNQKLFVAIFTDDPNPAAIMEKYQAQCANSRIQFVCRSAGNTFYSNVLEDFFAMAKFDCLIRPESNMSLMAEKIGNHKIVIAPARYVKYNKLHSVSKINAVTIIQR